MRFSLVVVAALACVCRASAKPFFSFMDFEIPDVTNCHGLVCPEGTVACIKNATSTDDKQMRTEITCRDTNDRVLKNDVKLSPHPDGSFVSTWSYRMYISQNVHDVEPVSNAPKEENKDIETFD